jgi:hypothetical protein
MAEKLIVTNEAALRAKYAAKGWKNVQAEVMKLIAADAKRGLTTQLVRLDKKADMDPLKAPVVRNANSAPQNKRAIDAVWKALEPHYLMILGATDVVPHQILRNPVGGAGGDGDATVPSDLPYACDAPIARDVEAFVAASRAVGRLPNVRGDDDPAYLVRLLRYAQRWHARPGTQYGSGFVLTASVWKSSTRLSARKLFGSSRGTLLCPPKKPVWPSAKLAKRVHFINCHGATINPHYFGEGRNGAVPVAHRSRALAGLREGTAAAAECCYGAELYDPDSIGTDPAMANAYLGKGTYGFLGSTNIAYGPASGNGKADLICQYFIRHVKNGASVGRAALAARLDYVQKNQPLDPLDLKTLGQFYLLGDPSMHPVKAAGRGAKAVPTPRSRRSRRRSLARRGRKLAHEALSVLSKPDRFLKKARTKTLTDLASKAAMGTPGVRIFELREPKVGKSKSAGDGELLERIRAKKRGVVHVMIESKGSPTSKAKTLAAAGAPIKTRRIIMVKEIGGRVMKTEEYYPR